jgi:hypothetical protein
MVMVRGKFAGEDSFELNVESSGFPATGTWLAAHCKSRWPDRPACRSLGEDWRAGKRGLPVRDAPVALALVHWARSEQIRQTPMGQAYS